MNYIAEFITMKVFCSEKNTVNKIRRPQTGRKIFVKDISDKWLVSKMYNKSLKSTIRKQTMRLQKWTKKTWRDTLPKKICRWRWSIWKYVPHNIWLGNCTLRQQWDITTHWLEWLKSQTLTTPHIGMNVEQQCMRVHCLSEFKMVHFEGLEVWQNLTYYCFLQNLTYYFYHVIQQWSFLVFTQINWNICPHKNLHMDIYSSFIHNCPNVEATKMSFSGWVDK